MSFYIVRKSPNSERIVHDDMTLKTARAMLEDIFISYKSTFSKKRAANEKCYWMTGKREILVQTEDCGDEISYKILKN